MLHLYIFIWDCKFNVTSCSLMAWWQLPPTTNSKSLCLSYYSTYILGKHVDFWETSSQWFSAFTSSCTEGCRVLLQPITFTHSHSPTDCPQFPVGLICMFPKCGKAPELGLNQQPSCREAKSETRWLIWANNYNNLQPLFLFEHSNHPDVELMEQLDSQSSHWLSWKESKWRFEICQLFSFHWPKLTFHISKVESSYFLNDTCQYFHVVLTQTRHVTQFEVMLTFNCRYARDGWLKWMIIIWNILDYNVAAFVCGKMKIQGF